MSTDEPDVHRFHAKKNPGNDPVFVAANIEYIQVIAYRVYRAEVLFQF